MTLAKEGWREIAIGTVVLGALALAGGYFFWPLAVPFALIWVWLLSFFRDPRRDGPFAAHLLYSPADGTVTEVTRLAHEPLVGGPAVRIGIFLSIFNVHINRSPCAGTVRSIATRPGKFLDARHESSGAENQSTTLVLETDATVPSPIVVRQVAGMIARRIICHARVDERLASGQRYGLIKFGSRTELIVPDVAGLSLSASVGQKVFAGVTVLGEASTEKLSN